MVSLLHSTIEVIVPNTKSLKNGLKTQGERKRTKVDTCSICPLDVRKPFFFFFFPFHPFLKKRINVGHNELSLCSVKSRLFIYCFPSPDHILGSTFLLSNISSGTMNNRMAVSNLRYAFQMN